MRQFYLTARNPTRRYELRQYIDGAEEIKIDASSWAEENGALTTATWSVETGQAAMSNQALASSVATATLTTSQTGRSLVRAKLTNGTETINMYFTVISKDPQYGEGSAEYLDGYW